VGLGGAAHTILLCEVGATTLFLLLKILPSIFI
jgi:hypothetical protein